MPSGPEHWHEHWKDDGNALAYLEKRGFKDNQGFITDPPIQGFQADYLDLAAISYLIQEWDYAYETRRST